MARGLSLRELADRLSVSPSLISQIETGRARPSVNSLYAIAAELGVSLDDLLFPDADREAHADPDAHNGHDENGPRNDHDAEGGPARLSQFPVQRSHDRKRIRLASGVVWERLTTTSEFGYEFLHVTYEVGGASSPVNEFQRHGGREWGYIISGTLGITVAFDDYELGPGDSVTIDSSQPHRLCNRGTTPVHAIWFVAGRSGAERGTPVHGQSKEHEAD
jgi:transcriptional regulator with XRE-family HTH domain